MSKIEFTSNGTTYTLEFDRDSVSRAETAFDLSFKEATSGKVSACQTLFLAALIKHHPNIKPSVAMGFWDAMPEKTALNEALVKMYAETVGSLMDDPEEGKAISWKAV